MVLDHVVFNLLLNYIYTHANDFINSIFENDKIEVRPKENENKDNRENNFTNHIGTVTSTMEGIQGKFMTNSWSNDCGWKIGTGRRILKVVGFS